MRISSGGKLGDVVGRGDQEDGWRWSCIHDSSVPNIRCDSPPSAESRAGRGEGLFDLVDPEHGRGHRLGLLEGLAEPGLALADELLVEHARVHPHQRHAPGRGDHLGAEALAAALHAQQQDPRGGSRPNSRAPLEKPPCRRLSHRFRFFSPPISSGETSATIGSRQPVVPRRLRLASTIRGSSEPSRTLRSWIAPETTRAASSLVSPCKRLHQQLQLPLGQLRFDLLQAAALGVLKGVAHDLQQLLSSGQPMSRGTVSRRTSGGSPTASTRISVHKRESGAK